MKMNKLLIGLCALGSLYTSGASAEVVQDCVLSGEVIGVNEYPSDTLRVRFHDIDHGAEANCNKLKRRSMRNRVDANITMVGLELPLGSKVTYAFQQTRSDTTWELLSVQRPVLLSVND